MPKQNFSIIGGPRDGGTYSLDLNEARLHVWVLLAQPPTPSELDGNLQIPILDRYLIYCEDSTLCFDPEASTETDMEFRLRLLGHLGETPLNDLDNYAVATATGVTLDQIAQHYGLLRNSVLKEMPKLTDEELAFIKTLDSRRDPSFPSEDVDRLLSIIKRLSA